ncbi:DUF1214 domain-containing protein [Sphingomonas sp.]|jgi:hypothetical protein|uniref:DUF1214 domain-containing protein n=1 Tax=Sphingomonas sp. TaxID=28214 RepID=UPI002E31FF49|nr:DUF1214 domain-containing protein [Sphingomonas sp.]HEX4693002.1 DUF1214 domain-containing protein [Sphingomonas sp.]
MKPWVRYLICGVAGLALGAGGAYRRIHTGALGANSAIGPWTTGKDFGTAGASAYTRAVIALRGILALPAHEARYYNAAVDSAGDPLDGKCRYRVSGRTIPSKWWSVTLYDHQGYLVPNQANIFSVESSHVPSMAGWTIEVAPAQQAGLWLPTGRIDRFELTLRTYLPDDGGIGNLTRDQLPSIVKEGC